MNERIKELRLYFGLTLDKFGERLGVSKSGISKIEKGNRGVTEQMKKSICREFNVDYLWLTEGIGEMFQQHDDDVEVHAMVDRILEGQNEHVKNLFIEAAKNLNDEDWNTINDIIDKLLIK